MLALALAGIAGVAQAQVSDGVIKIGVLTDMSSLYTDLAGAGSVTAAKMAIEDSGIEKRGYKIELVVSADHQNKADVGSDDRPSKWYDVDKVDVIVDVPNSGVALAVSPDHQGQEQGVPGVGTGFVGPDRKGMLAQYRALDLRYLDAGQRHGQRESRSRAATRGSSSPPITRSGRRSSATPRPWC